MDSEEDIKKQAREWLLRFSLESATPEERVQFATWCAEDPRRAEAYRRFESIWQEAATLEELKPLATLRPARDPWWRRVSESLVVHSMRWVGGATVAGAGVALGVWYLLAPVYYATGVAEVRNIYLSDGSDVTLGARSSLKATFRLHERRVALTSGVAFFSVSKNASRPFIVVVGDKEVRVVGTKFEVRRDPEGMRVSVVEGTVEVMQVAERASETAREPPRSVRLAVKTTQPKTSTLPDGAPIEPTLHTSSENPEERILTAGQQITAGLAGAIPDPQPMPRAEPAAWRHGRLVYVDATLKDIIADVNRYSREPVVIADESAANVRVSVTCPSDRVEEMLSALSRSLSLKIERSASGGIVLKSKEQSD